MPHQKLQVQQKMAQVKCTELLFSPWQQSTLSQVSILCSDPKNGLSQFPRIEAIPLTQVDVMKTIKEDK